MLTEFKETKNRKLTPNHQNRKNNLKHDLTKNWMFIFIGVELLSLQYKKWGFTIVFTKQRRIRGKRKRKGKNMGTKWNIGTTSLLLLLAFVAQVSAGSYFDVTQYGAVGGGKTDISKVRRQ